jgi:cysteine desulfurase
VSPKATRRPDGPDSRVYLDWNATTPPRDEVLTAMEGAARTAWANPSSIHADGRAARAAVEDARAAVAMLVGVSPRDVTFTAGGTEANNLALRSLAAGAAGRGTIVTSRIEHPSITRVAESLEREGKAKVRWLGVTPGGMIDLEDLARALEEIETDTVSVVTVQAVNHETGVLQPVADVVRLAHARGAKVHLDAVQGWGKIDVPNGWDTATVAPHKMRGPKGIGALAVREGVRIDPVLLGGSQEKGIRPGTVAPALAAGFGVAAALASPARWAEIAPLRDRLEAALLALDPPHGRAIVAGDRSRRAPHVTNMVWPGWIGAELVAALDLEGVSVSSGAACSAGTVEPSPVIGAMLGPELGIRAVRISLGDLTTEEDVARAVEALAVVLARSR